MAEFFSAMEATNPDKTLDGSCYLVTEAMAFLSRQVDKNLKILSVKMEITTAEMEVDEYPVRVNHESIDEDHPEIWMDSDIFQMLNEFGDLDDDADTSGTIIEIYKDAWKQAFEMYNERRCPRSMWDAWLCNSRMLLNMVKDGDITTDTFEAYLNNYIDSIGD